MAGFLVATTYARWSGVLATESSASLLGILIGGVLVAVAGFLEDARRISPLQGFLWQCMAASVTIGAGVRVRILPLIGVELVLTLCYLVGCANAVNLLDGIDGLAGGTSIIAALSFGLIATIQGNGFVAVLALALAGAVLGFLPFNFPRARISMGDVGSLFLGFTLASFAVLLTDRPYDLLRFAVPLTVLGVPMLNMALVLIRRFRLRDDLFRKDRDHPYDLLAQRWGNRRPVWWPGIEADTTRQRVLIVGTGEEGQLLLWLMQRRDNRYVLVGFVDDDLEKVGLRIHDVRVLGTIAQIPDIVARYQIDLIVIAIDGADRERLNEIFDICREASVRIQILPNIMTQLTESNEIKILRDLTIEDLLGRPPREIDKAACQSLIAGKVVLVTGAAGFIGSELCRRITYYGPEQVLAVDQNETRLRELVLKLGKENVTPWMDHILVPLVGDVTNVGRMETIWHRYRPAVVFHCAAYKHVSMLEGCPTEAVKTNVQGTLVPATLSQQWGAEQFIFVSTDEAVCPVSILGASKRVGELLMMAMHNPSGNSTKFSSVRFGSVLGSQGGIVSTLARQIDRGGPVTIAHPQMERFFMSIQEAASLVIQAGAYTTGGDLFVLDMGEKVRIGDVAHKMIQLRGLRMGKDVQIEYIGVPPGEKLSEILFCPVYEVLEPTRHSSILRARNHNSLPQGDFVSSVSRMIELARQSTECEDFELRALLFDMARLLCPAQCARVPDETAQSVISDTAD